MKIAIIYSRAAAGIHAPLVTIEVHLSSGLPSMSIVGLPEAAVRESKDRVRSAILNNRFDFPLHRITINLAPADLPKDGGRFDLAVALGILAASNQLPCENLEHYEFIGELALTGELRPIRGILPVARAAKEAGRTLILPAANVEEAMLVKNAELFAAGNLMAICAHLTGVQSLPRPPVHVVCDQAVLEKDLCDVRAQQHAKRALEIAAAGGHHLIMIGPPGTGKTMLAERLPGIMPPMTESEALESAAVASISSLGFHVSRWKQRPFRSPHHTASGVALVGGGSHPRPGEISLAHHGVLFLDELPEFDRRVLEVLREPLESGRIVISRAAHQSEFPAQFQMVAAMNPCPCGYLGEMHGRCRCTADQVQRYRQRISGPLLDRIDLHVEVPNVPRQILLQKSRPPCESSVDVQTRIIKAHKIQLARAGKSNHRLNNREVENFCALDNSCDRLLEQAIERLGLSARAMHRILKVARTIADLEDAKQIRNIHIGEAITYRRLDRTVC